MSKKRTKSQRIGEKGEHLLSSWALDNNLSASKADYDYGMDFYFQHFKKNGDMEIATGKFFSGQCKTTEKKGYKYVSIYKSDVLLYMTSNIPVCIFGIDLENKCIRYRFIDNKLIDQFIAFINSSNNELCLNFDTILKDDITIAEDIKNHVTSSAITKLKNYLLSSLISMKAGNTEVITHSIKDKILLELNPVFITQIIKPEDLFDSKKNKNLIDFIDVNILEVINTYLPDYYSIAISGDLGIPKTLSTNGVSIKVISYPYDGKICYHFKSGFILCIGPCEYKDGQHIHSISFKLVASNFSYYESKEDVIFFKKLLANKQLEIEGNHIIDDITQLENIFNILDHLRYVDEIQNEGRIDFSRIYLSDLNNQDFFQLINVLWILLFKKKLHYLNNGFILGNYINLKDLKKRKCKGIIPLIFTLYETNYVCKIFSNFSYLLNNNVIVGISIDEINFLEIKTFLYNETENFFPQLWIFNDWPAILLKKDEIKTFKYERHNRPFELLATNIED